MAEAWTQGLRQWLDGASRAAGFDVCGVAAVSATPGARDARFEAWVDAGHAGEMEYLKRRDERGVLLRSGVQVAMPWARSVIVCAFNYNADAPRSLDPAEAGAGWIARYAWSGRRDGDGPMRATDYHDELMGRLRRIESELLGRAPATTRCYVDTGPLLERDLAARAGVGWIGRNTCVLNQGLGSWLLLAAIVTSLEVPDEVAALPAEDRCGLCTRCIDACPTGALLNSSVPGAVREMDASRCIAYLTIEKKGSIEEALRTGMGRQVFGCDICQEVCPWNRKAVIGRQDGMEARAELLNPALEWLAAMDAKEFKQRFRGSPLERTGRRRLMRNVAIAMGNSGERRFLPRLEAWADGLLDGAEGLADDPVLRESAAWAKARILEKSKRE